MKRKLLLISMCTLVAFLLPACSSAAGESTGTTETASEEKSEETSLEETVVEESLSESADIEENAAEIEEFFISEEDYEYCFYDEDGKAIVGYNTPTGYHLDTDDSSERCRLFRRSGTYDGDPDIYIYHISNTYDIIENYKNIKDEEYTIEELEPVQTMYGEFKVFDKKYNETSIISYSEEIIAILPKDGDGGIKVSCYKGYKGDESKERGYQGTIEELLGQLFEVRENSVEIPSGYEIYLESDAGKQLIGFNAPQGFEVVENEEDFGYPNITFSNGETKIYVAEPTYMQSYLEDGIVPDYAGNIYEQKGTVDSIYGEINLYDVAYTASDGQKIYYQEAGIVCVNGHCIVITYMNYEKTDNIESIVQELFEQ